MNPLRIGTRRSRLAIAQAELVRDLLVGIGAEAQIVPMTTSGDEGKTAESSAQGLKGLWTDTILDALEAGTLDLAVHSAKDLPAEEDDLFVIGAVPERSDPFDVLISRGETLPPGAVVGTSSLRRRAQLLASFPDIVVADLGGNVDTRLAKLADGKVGAVVLAAAGLARLAVEPPFARTLTVEEMVPAPGQGALAIQCRDDDEATAAALRAIDHAPSHAALNAERSLMWRLGGGCALPLGAYAEWRENTLHLVAVVGTPEGDRLIRANAEGDEPEAVARDAARQLIELGAEEILAEVRET